MISNEDLLFAYRKTFTGKYGQIVAEDLARFCRDKESTFHPDARVHALGEGRREVWLRIEKFSDKNSMGDIV